jgi:hypothetical protein
LFAIGRQRPGVAALVVRHLNYYEHLPETTLPMQVQVSVLTIDTSGACG